MDAQGHFTYYSFCWFAQQTYQQFPGSGLESSLRTGITAMVWF